MTTELDRHQPHLEHRRYDIEHCSLCIELYFRAKENHSEHAGFPHEVEGGLEERKGWWVRYHDPQQCIDAYRSHGKRMSAS